MADFPHSAPTPPRGWAEAFAILPQEGPVVAAWPAIAARLEARRRSRWPLWLATAAALALVAVVPLQRRADDGAPRRPPGEVAATGSDRAPATDANPAARASVPRLADNHGTIDSAPVAATGTATTPGTPATRPGSPPRATAAAPRSDPATGAEFERLYAESAQLETLLDLARDERVASGPAAAMAGELDAYVASIDTALSQPALPPAQRLALWDQRVDAMRQVVGFASTQRLLAASGDRFDGALVAVD